MGLIAFLLVLVLGCVGERGWDAVWVSCKRKEERKKEQKYFDIIPLPGFEPRTFFLPEICYAGGCIKNTRRHQQQHQRGLYGFRRKAKKNSEGQK